MSRYHGAANALSNDGNQGLIGCIRRGYARHKK